MQAKSWVESGVIRSEGRGSCQEGDGVTCLQSVFKETDSMLVRELYLDFPNSHRRRPRPVSVCFQCLVLSFIKTSVIVSVLGSETCPG